MIDFFIGDLTKTDLAIRLFVLGFVVLVFFLYVYGDSEDK